MSKDVIEIEGEIKKVLPFRKFEVLLSQGHLIEAKVSGKMQVHKIKLVVGDRVKVEISPYDLTKGRIIYRVK